MHAKEQREKKLSAYITCEYFLRGCRAWRHFNKIKLQRETMKLQNEDVMPKNI